jgi:hypothetical protein
VGPSVGPGLRRGSSVGAFIIIFLDRCFCRGGTYAHLPAEEAVVQKRMGATATEALAVQVLSILRISFTRGTQRIRVGGRVLECLKQEEVSDGGKG